jgi:hypothetical protein
MQRIVKWSPREAADEGWQVLQLGKGWPTTDVDSGHVASFDFATPALDLNPELAEALTYQGKLGVIREMNHEVRDDQRIFIFLVEF